MGTVHRAFDPAIGRAVAVKVMRTGHIDPALRAEFLGRFAAEVRAAAGCTHPAIVVVHDVGGDLDGTGPRPPFIVMELVEGGTLADRLATPETRAALSPEAVLLPILDALATVHRAGIVHRDVKPANILLAPDGSPRLTDFGIARLGQAANHASLTQTGTMIGTPSYMAPEQARGEPADHGADLFAVGCILHEMLAGSTPFGREGIGPTLMALLGPEPATLEAVQAVAPRYTALLARALAKDRAQRFASAAEFASALAGLADGRGSPTLAVPRPGAGLPAPGADNPAPFDQPFLTAISADLVAHLGPITGTLVRRAAAQASSRDALVRTLSGHLRPELRGGFLRHAAAAVAQPAASRPAPALAPEHDNAPDEAARLRACAILRQEVGPIADLFVGRAAAEATSSAGFVDILVARLRLDEGMRWRLQAAVQDGA